MKRYAGLFYILFLFVSCATQKPAQRNDASGIANLQSHIRYLADDKLEGRRAGSAGEKLAMDYIAEQFSSIGLAAKGTDGFFQPFDIIEGKQINPGTSFSIGNKMLEPGKDFFPLPYSANQKIEALPAIAVQESDMPWFFNLRETLEQNKANPHFDLYDYIYNNAKKAATRGAAAVILYNNSDIDDKLAFLPKDRAEKLSIPVVYITRETARKYLSDESATLDVKLNINIGEKKVVGHNVIGFLDNGQPNTVVLGAHFDHLGYGNDGNSLSASKEKTIHNGADDNASGTAAIIELARILKTGKAKHNNYLFIAFSGEELGLLGSKYFTANPTIPLATVSYMINLDMVGRLNETTPVVTVYGVGTSPIWTETLNLVGKDNKDFAYKFDSSGTGPSDHTSFYRSNIPVLFYFTGLHTDYHKPGDDPEKINYAGEWKVIQQINNLVNAVDNKGKLSFLKTREVQMATNTALKVTLGIMPDYSYSGTGVRADGVTEGRPAAKAGLRAGDIILQLGDYSVNSMDSYMQALGKFNKGEKTKLKYKRGTEILETTIEF